MEYHAVGPADATSRNPEGPDAAAEVMKQLERKDEEDKATALAAVEKVAKKYKKAMKKK